MRFLILLVGIVIVFLLLKKYFRTLQGPAPSAKPPLAEDMVRCAQCGVNLPQSEAIFSRGEYFCGDEHRQLRQS